MILKKRWFSDLQILEIGEQVSREENINETFPNEVKHKMLNNQSND